MSLRLRAACLAVLCVLLACAASAQPPAGVEGGHDREWRFRVYLDDKEIGSHNFFLTEGKGVQQLKSEADFVYKLMFIKLYEYRHRNTETWDGECLAEIESETDANGRPFFVSGTLEGAGFRVSGSEGEALLPGCVSTFAYWNPDFLQQRRLLNTQNGEYVEVEVQAPQADALEIGGSMQPVQRYRLKAGELELKLWYSPQREWLALETTTGGRTLRYERI